MSIRDKIRAEIERRIKLYSVTNEKEQWIVNTYWSVLSFLDTLIEEPQELDKAAKEYAYTLTIGDIELLHTFLFAVKNNKIGAFTFTRLSDDQYKEVLNRFNKAKGTK